MTSKERVRAVMRHEKPDRVPAAFEAVPSVQQKLLDHYGLSTVEDLYEKFDIDIIPAAPRYIGPELPSYLDEQGRKVTTDYWGCRRMEYKTAVDTYGVALNYPFDHVETMADANACQYPDPDWFDYSAITETCRKYPDKAIIIGHEGPFQQITAMMQMDNFFYLMEDEPGVAKKLLDRMVDFEMEYYRRCFIAGEGNVDILRTHDDYGTQISLLFSEDMWRGFFKENTIRLVNLAHDFGAFFQQHSCGAVAPLIPDLIECGVDSLEPLQKVNGLRPSELAANYGGLISFHGGIDTQRLLPRGTPEKVTREVLEYERLLGDRGYILMASQAFEGDVPIENIEAIYNASRALDE